MQAQANCNFEFFKVSAQMSGASNVIADLQLLREIEGTIDGLQGIERMLEDFLQFAELLLERVPSCKEIIDSTGEGVHSLEVGEQQLAKAINNVKNARLAALGNPKPKGDHENDVVMAYDRVIKVAADLHNTSVDLRWAVMENDADLDDSSVNSPAFNNIGDLIKSLRI